MVIEVTFFHINVFLKSVKNTHCYQFLWKDLLQSVSLKNIFEDIEDLAFIAEITFSRNFENNGHKNINFRKIFKSYPDELKFIPANVS